jgi:predicted 3-demethylubiquinone-9 3-methyltransferase (glyoxalase superfamily)
MNTSIYPCLWFDNQAQEAANYYCNIFPNSKIISSNPMAVIFELKGERFMGLNGGPSFKFNEAVSFVISCETQADIDYYWEKLTQNGEEGKCGWLKDQYGVSWQVVPAMMDQWMNNPEKAPKVMYAFMQMKKLNIEKLMQASS